ncbi:MAG TPA: UbiD family decarboxylase domain-containing protein [Vicinamibacteria bacterium]|nr:UbiD family decarboxylase domain-containing protein [Vicinamibacteria bacterium]
MTDLSFADLRAYLDQLRRDGDLAVVEAEVDPCLEAAEVHRRVIAAGGPALLFTRPRGADVPLATNLFGTARRAEVAFGKRPGRLVRRLVELAETLVPPTPGKLWGARDVLREALRIGLARRGSGPVTEVVTDDVRLDRLPVLTCWPEDGGPFVTLPLVYTEEPLHGAERGHGEAAQTDDRGETTGRDRAGPGGDLEEGQRSIPTRTGGPGRGVGRSNLAIYRLHVHDERTTGMHWQIGKGGGFHHAVAEGRGESLPVTVFLGGPPALILAAIAPLPENVPELMLASLIAGRRLERCPGPGPHPLVASAEMALVGHVPPGVRQPEGPFGDHYGYYSLRHDYPVFRAERLCRRRDAIYPATVVGKPRQEDFFVGDLLQELLSPLFPLVMPGVVDLWSYGETGYHSLAAAVVRERYKREAMASAFRILGEGQLSLTKFLLVTDRPVDLRDFRATLEHVLARTRPETDLYVFSNLSMDTLDYTGPAVNEGSKGVWLGLGDPVRELPREFRPAVPLPSAVTDVRVFCGGCLVVGGPPAEDDPDAGSRLAAHPAFRGWPLLVLTDEPGRAAASPMNFLWTTFTRFEPAADVHAAATRVVRHQVVHEPPVLIDARRKPSFPREVSCDPDTAALVSRRWREYFPEGQVEMGDSDLAHLDRG